MTKLNYFFSLYWRNVKNTVLKPYKALWEGDEYGEYPGEIGVLGPIIIGIVYGLLLLTCIPFLAATVKTFFDFFTRKLLSKNDLVHKRQVVESMEPQDLNELSKRMLSYRNDACSDSSKTVLEELAKAPNDAEKKRLILAYLDEPKNNGKKLMQITFGIFSKTKISMVDTSALLSDGEVADYASVIR